MKSRKSRQQHFDAKVPSSFDIHLVSEEGVVHLLKAADPKMEIAPQEYHIQAADIGTEINYGPWKNIFYICYFTLTGVHGLHVVGGLIPLTILLVQGLRGQNFRQPYRVCGPLLAFCRPGAGFSCFHCCI